MPQKTPIIQTKPTQEISSTNELKKSPKIVQSLNKSSPEFIDGISALEQALDQIDLLVQSQSSMSKLTSDTTASLNKNKSTENNLGSMTSESLTSELSNYVSMMSTRTSSLSCSSSHNEVLKKDIPPHQFVAQLLEELRTGIERISEHSPLHPKSVNQSLSFQTQEFYNKIFESPPDKTKERQLQNQIDSLQLQLDITREQFNAVKEKSNELSIDNTKLKNLLEKTTAQSDMKIRAGLEQDRAHLLEALTLVKLENQALKDNLARLMSTEECLRNDDVDSSTESQKDYGEITDDQLHAMREELKQLKETRQNLISSESSSIKKEKSPDGDEGVFLTDVHTSTNNTSPKDTSGDEPEIDNKITQSDVNLRKNHPRSMTSSVAHSNINAFTKYDIPETISTPNIAANDFRPRQQSGSMLKLFNSFRKKGKQKNYYAARTPRPDSTAWSADQVSKWFETIGLSQYGNRAKTLHLTGLQLLRCVDQPQEMLKLGKQLKFVSPFHRRKLELAAHEVFYPPVNCLSSPGSLDYHFMMRWLDDIGLPQYKEAFEKSYIDGRVLNSMTLDELQTLGVSLEIHYASLRRGIQLLRNLDFQDDFFIRRPKREGETQNDVIFWSNHRVMEWLHSIDLSEYASTLRGSGVHGALLVLEPRFNHESLSNLLNIPKQKNLLRKHLKMKFNELLSEEALLKKSLKNNKDQLNHVNKYKPRKIRQKILEELPKSEHSNIGWCFVCPRPVNPNLLEESPRRNSVSSAPSHASVMKKPTHIRQASQPSLYRSKREDDSESQRSDVEASGKVVGGMAALENSLN